MITSGSKNLMRDSGCSRMVTFRGWVEIGMEWVWDGVGIGIGVGSITEIELMPLVRAGLIDGVSCGNKDESKHISMSYEVNGWDGFDGACNPLFDVIFGTE